MRGDNERTYEDALATVAEANEVRQHRRLTLTEAAEAARAFIEVRVAEDRHKAQARERYERKKASKARFWRNRG